MSTKRSMAYLRLVVGGLAVLLAAIILLTNLGNPATVHLLVASYDQTNASLVMLLSAGAGIVLYVMIQWVVRGLLDLRATRGEVRRRTRPAAGESGRTPPST